MANIKHNNLPGKGMFIEIKLFGNFQQQKMDIDFLRYKNVK